ncbi:MAG: Plug domain-containing protein, partial [Muribaculaceae bacterium]|nr:Plug domain-containing protein [Muribaculaceae bacterium]
MPCFAQSDEDTLHLAELTVTAMKQVDNMASVPSAITVVGRDEASRNRVMSTKAVADLAPGLFIPDYGSRMTSTIYVRGLGTRIDQPAVGLNVDNVPMLCKENYDMDLMDIDHIEVLRGPQSTLYGRN